MAQHNSMVQKVGIVVAYIICVFAAFNIFIYLVGLLEFDVKDMDWIEYSSNLLYHVFVLLFTGLCVIRWLKHGKLTTSWMLLSMLVSAIIVYVLLSLTCKWEPDFLRFHGMTLYAPWWLNSHWQFFKDLIPDTVPPFYKINVLDNNVFLYTLCDYPGLLVWVLGCCLGRVTHRTPQNEVMPLEL